jgi:hypothetical protein
VFFLVGLRFVMLAGLLAGWRWEVPGAVVVLVSSVPFFAATAGRNFPWFAPVTAVPPEGTNRLPAGAVRQGGRRDQVVQARACRVSLLGGALAHNAA